MKLRPTPLLVGIAVMAFAGARLSAQSEYIWEISSGTNLNWNDPNNWAPNSAFPNAPGDTARVDQDIINAQLIRLQQDITVGTLVLGDASASGNNFGYTIGNDTGDAFTFSFDSGDEETAAELRLSVSGTPTNSLSVPVLLNSDLSINLGNGSQTLTIGSLGSLSMGTESLARDVTVSGGTVGVNQVNLTGNLDGSGTFTNNSNGAIVVTGTKTFTGTFVLNKGIGGSNTGSITVTSGSIANAAEIVINGYLSGNGVVQNGGSLHAGNNAAQINNPGQRFTSNRITMNGGTLTDFGQLATTGTANPWQMGQEAVRDEVSEFNLNSGFNFIHLSVAGNTMGTVLDIGTLERSPGASAYVRSSTLGQANGSRVLVGNSDDYLLGGGGLAASPTMSIIPWIAANNTGTATQVPTGFATYTGTGIRALDLTTEYSTSITAGEDHNVNTGTIGIAGPTTVNSLRFTGGTSNIGAGQTLTIASGAVYFSTTNGTIGGAGIASAGILDFGDEEGVVWAIGTNNNVIGASLTGSSGLTKAGTGKLTLAGLNDYEGLTYVGGGILQVGDGIRLSNLGTGDVTVANGAILSLLNGGAIDDDATLTLEQFGLFNGFLDLGSGVNETVAELFFGAVAAEPGTYGSTTSSATFQDNTYFTGTGVLTVVPEPGSAFALVTGALVVGLRRRRS